MLRARTGNVQRSFIREIMERLIVAKQAADLHSNGFVQRVLQR